MAANLNDDDNDPALISKKFWGHVKTTCKSTRIPESISYRDIIRNDPIGQADIFNDFFVAQFSDASSYDIDIDFVYDELNDIDFSVQTVRNLLKQVKPKKAPGPDGVHGMVLKHCAFGLAYPLSKLFKLSYNTGIIPHEWKLANVVPVYKKDDKSNVENYRPISLTCLMMKILEKLVRDKILDKCKDLLNPHQHGFLPGRSCTTQMIGFSDSLGISLNDNIQTDVIYLDFAKAFDSVNHDIILHKLKTQYGIDGILLKFIANYLKDRGQCVTIGGKCSQMRSVLSGVPQGSILGPLLFVLFINDITDCVSNGTNIALYADDTKIWRTIESWHDYEILQKDIDSLYAWASENKMNFHPKKCKVLTVARSRKSLPDFVSALPFLTYLYCMNDTYLEVVTSEKDLGVIVTSSLSQNEQCLQIYNKSSSKLGLLKRVCHFTKSVQQRRALYLAVVRSQLNHCCVMWRPTSDTMINKLERIQKRAVKWILNEEDHHYNDIEYLSRLRDLDLLPLKYLFTLNDLIIFHKIFYKHNDYCVELPSYLRPYEVEERRRLRTTVTAPTYLNDCETSITDFSAMREMSLDSKSLKCTIVPKCSQFRSSYFFRTHLLWNYIPLDVRSELCPLKFKKLLLLHLWDVLLKPD